MIVSVPVRRHVRGIPGDADAAGPRGAVLVRVPAGRGVRAAEQRAGGARGRVQAVPRGAAALRRARQEHRQLAGGWVDGCPQSRPRCRYPLLNNALFILKMCILVRSTLWKQW